MAEPPPRPPDYTQARVYARSVWTNLSRNTPVPRPPSGWDAAQGLQEALQEAEYDVVGPEGVLAFIERFYGTNWAAPPPPRPPTPPSPPRPPAALAEASEALRALPDDAAHALDPEPGGGAGASVPPAPEPTPLLVSPGLDDDRYAKHIWDRILGAKGIRGADRPGSLEEALAAGVMQGRFTSERDVRRFIDEFKPGQVPPAPTQPESPAFTLPLPEAPPPEPAGPPPVPESAALPAFVHPGLLGGKPDAALRAAQDAALAAGLSPQDANAAGRAAADHVLAHGTSPETVHKRELLRGVEAGLPPDEAVRLAREAGDRAAAAREAVGASSPAAPETLPFALPLPDVPAAATGPGGAGGGQSLPAPGPAPWDDFTGLVQAAEEAEAEEEEPPLAPLTTPPRRGGKSREAAQGHLGELEPGWFLRTADRLTNEVLGPGEPPDRPPRSRAPRGGSSGPLDELEPGWALSAGGRLLDEVLGPGDDGGEARAGFGGGTGGGEGAGGAGMMEVLVRIAEGVERLIEAVGELAENGGRADGPGHVGGARDYGWEGGEADETPASPSVDLSGLPRPGRTRDAYGHPRAESPKRQSPAGEH